MKKFDVACIIDDDPIFIFGTKKMMQLSNFCNSFLVFHNGKDALDFLKPIIENHEKGPEIILLDLNMPIMDGWQFLDEFIKIPTSHTILIYIVSSSVDPADIEKATRYKSVTNYIIKPITMANLKEIVDGN